MIRGRASDLAPPPRRPPEHPHDEIRDELVQAVGALHERGE